jgi:hypothetical protein
MLCFALAEREDIVFKLEIFHPYVQNAKKEKTLIKNVRDGYPTLKPGICKNIFTNISETTESWIEANSSYHQLVKISTYYLPINYAVWNDILSNPYCHFIYLKRPQFLDVVISNAEARACKKWVVRKNEEIEAVPIVLNPEAVLEEFLFLEKSVKYFDTIFSKRKNIIWLDYNTMCNNWQAEMARIQDELDLETTVELYPETKRQITTDHQNLVSNYDQVVEYFKGTKWEKYFK